LHLQFWPALGRSRITSSAAEGGPDGAAVPPLHVRLQAHFKVAPRTSLRVRNVPWARRTAVPGATLVGVGVGRRTVLPSPLSSKAQPLTRRRTPFAGLAATSSHPDRTIPGVLHGDARGTGESISQIILTPRRTWPGGRSPGLAAASPGSKRTGRRTSRGCTARGTQH